MPPRMATERVAMRVSHSVLKTDLDTIHIRQVI